MVFHKRGHFPNYSYLKYGDPVFSIKLGQNYIHTDRKRLRCMLAFQASEMTDRDAKSCVREAPVFPKNIKNSGHCKLVFDVSKTGRPINVRATFCTEPHFEKISVYNVKWWFYEPKVERGQAVERLNVKTMLRYDLQGPNGEILPEFGSELQD